MAREGRGLKHSRLHPQIITFFKSKLEVLEYLSHKNVKKKQMEWSCYIIRKWTVKLWSEANSGKFKPVSPFRPSSIACSEWPHVHKHVLCVPVCTTYVCCSCRFTSLLTYRSRSSSIHPPSSILFHLSLPVSGSRNPHPIAHPIPSPFGRTEPWPLQRPRGCWPSFAETWDHGIRHRDSDMAGWSWCFTGFSREQSKDLWETMETCLYNGSFCFFFNSVVYTMVNGL